MLKKKFFLLQFGMPGVPLVPATQNVGLERRPEIELVQSVGVVHGDTASRLRRGSVLAPSVGGSEGEE